MAKTPVSDEELQLKKKARRRLVGAVVLVLLVVVFVPMFLDREPRPQKQDIDIRIPAIPGQTQPPVLPPSVPNASPPVLPPPAAAPAPDAANTPKEPASAPAASDTSPPPPAPAAPVEPAPKAAEPAGKPERKAPESAHKAEAKSADSFVIQVGAFSDPGNARHLVEKLKAEKIPAYTEAVKSSQGEKTRVRAGPYPTLAAAEHGRSRLKTLKLLPSGDAKIVHKGE